MARIVFLQRIWYEYSAPEIISAVLKNYGHKVELFIGNNSHDFIDKIYPGDIVCFSVMTGEHRWALKIASELKERKKILTVFGGPHPTYFPEIVKHPAVNIACRGEGEYAMLELANAHERGKDFSGIQNLILKENNGIKINALRPLISNLDGLPFFDRGIYYRYHFLRKSFSKPFMASRGCPYSCSFCFNGNLRDIYTGKGRFVRFRSPQNIIREIGYVKKRFGLGSVFFADDLFVLNKDWLKDFCSLYREKINKPFVCSANVHTLNETAIRLLKEGGCETVSFGIETGNENMRIRLLNKNIKNSQIEEIARLLKKI